MSARLAAGLLAGLALLAASPAAGARLTGLEACGPTVCRSAGSGDLPILPLTGRLRPGLRPDTADFYWVQATHKSGAKTFAHAYYYVPSENLLADNAHSGRGLEWFSVREPAANTLGSLTAALIPFKAQGRWPAGVPATRPRPAGGSNPALPIVLVALVLVILAVITRNRLSAARERATPSTTDTDNST